MTRSARGDFDLLLFGWAANAVDTNDFLDSTLCAKAIGLTNRVQWSNPQFDALLEKARMQRLPDQMGTYQNIQNVFFQEMPFIPLANAMQIGAWNNRMHGFERHSSSRFYFSKVWLSK